MISPLEKFKQSLLKTVEIQNTKFTFNPFIKIKSINKINVLAEGLKEVNGIKLEDFDDIKNSKKDLVEAIKDEIGNWDTKLTDLLFQKFVELIQNNKEINFEEEKDLRVYWKLRKIFSKEELDNFTDFDWQWAYWNVAQDEIDKEEFDDRALEKRKPWYNTQLFNEIRKHENLKKQQEEEQKLLLNKLMAEKGFKLENVELIDAEENDIPMVIEDK